MTVWSLQSGFTSVRTTVTASRVYGMAYRRPCVLTGQTFSKPRAPVRCTASARVAQPSAFTASATCIFTVRGLNGRVLTNSLSVWPRATPCRTSTCRGVSWSLGPELPRTAPSSASNSCIAGSVESRMWPRFKCHKPLAKNSLGAAPATLYAFLVTRSVLLQCHERAGLDLHKGNHQAAPIWGTSDPAGWPALNAAVNASIRSIGSRARKPSAGSICTSFVPCSSTCASPASPFMAIHGQ